MHLIVTGWWWYIWKHCTPTYFGPCRSNHRGDIRRYCIKQLDNNVRSVACVDLPHWKQWIQAACGRYGGDRVISLSFGWKQLGTWKYTTSQLHGLGCKVMRETLANCAQMPRRQSLTEPLLQPALSHSVAHSLVCGQWETPWINTPEWTLSEPPPRPFSLTATPQKNK